MNCETPIETATNTSQHHRGPNGSANERKSGPTVFSFFSGLGFLDLGFEEAGFNISLVNEFHSPFLAGYRYSRTKLKIVEPTYGHYENDVKDFVLGGRKKDALTGQVGETRREGGLIGFIGGPPCPDFSIGGKNRGGDGEYGKLSQTYMEMVSQQQPDFFLFENVKGLWQTKRHRAFYQGLRRRVHEAGYITTERLINTLEYAAPQDRPRILLIGFTRSFLRDHYPEMAENTFQLPHAGFPWSQLAPYPNGSALAFDWPETDPFEEDSQHPCPAVFPPN